MHFSKFKLHGLTNVLRHYTREYVQTDGHIDQSKCKDNIFLEGSITPEDANCKRVNETIQEEIKKRTGKDSFRKDAVVMVDLIITQPKQLGTEYNKEFFEKMNSFCQKTFGEDNQIYSVVHLDEATPHMHYSFVPFIKENEKEKLCCKEILTRQFLKEFHSKAEKETGYILTDSEDDRKKDLSLSDYKKLQDMKKEIEKLEVEQQTLNQMIDLKKNEIVMLDNEYNELSKTYDLYASKNAPESIITNEKNKNDINVSENKIDVSEIKLRAEQDSQIYELIDRVSPYLKNMSKEEFENQTLKYKDKVGAERVIKELQNKLKELTLIKMKKTIDRGR